MHHFVTADTVESRGATYSLFNNERAKQLRADKGVFLLQAWSKTMKNQEPAHPFAQRQRPWYLYPALDRTPDYEDRARSEPSNEESETLSESELMTRVLRDMEALGLINLGKRSEREHDAKDAA